MVLYQSYKLTTYGGCRQETENKKLTLQISRLVLLSPKAVFWIPDCARMTNFSGYFLASCPVACLYAVTCLPPTQVIGSYFVKMVLLCCKVSFFLLSTSAPDAERLPRFANPERERRAQFSCFTKLRARARRSRSGFANKCIYPARRMRKLIYRPFTAKWDPRRAGWLLRNWRRHGTQRLSLF